MTEIDHAASLQPEPAKPVLASQLLDLEEKQRRRFTRDGRPERLTTACVEIDDLLGGGGMERGIVVGMSAEGGDGRLISLNLLASILLSHLQPTTASSPTPAPAPKTRATIVDTTGSFPLTLLAKLLRSRIIAARATSVPQKDGQAGPGQAEAGLNADVKRCLEMVGISRVFDLEGLWDVLDEVKNGLAGPEEREATGSKHVKSTLGKRARESTEEAEIPNSDDDNGGTPLDSPLQPEEYRFPDQLVHSDEDQGVEILIVDSLTNIINELFTRKEKSHAHHLLSLLSLSLTHLTQSTNTLAILHNTTVPSSSHGSKSASNYNYYRHQQDQNQQQPQPQAHAHQAPTQSTSLFPSNPLKPALGQIFTQFPSLHLFLSSLPLKTSDAEALYGGAVDPDPDPDPDGERERESEPGRDGAVVEYCTVIEVLKDETPNLSQGKEARWLGYREGHWCAVEKTGGDESHHVRFRRTVFEPSGGSKNNKNKNKNTAAGAQVARGLGADERNGNGNDNDTGTDNDYGGRGVSNVAKIWGFGGRRV